jgi:cyclic 2,3-diphosphoglycerate synthase
VLVSDAVVVSMAEEPLADRHRVDALLEEMRGVKPGLRTVATVFRPKPDRLVEGMKVAFFSTAPPAQEGRLRRYLEERWGCRVVMYSCHLSDRSALRADLERPEMRDVEVVMTEIKAAAIDVVAEEADRRGLEVVFVDNEPIEVAPNQAGDLQELCRRLAELTSERWRTAKDWKR